MREPFEVRFGECVAGMAALDEASVDAVVCDPPYGLEFMGKEWDRFRRDDPGTSRYRGDRAGSHGETDGDDERFSRVALGGGTRATTYRCRGCGRRDQFRKEHGCRGVIEWRVEIIDPYAAPPTMLAFQEWCRRWASEAYRVLKPGGYLLAFGGTRTFHRLASGVEDAGFEIRDCLMWLHGQGFPKNHDVSKAIDARLGAEREVVGRGAKWSKNQVYGEYATEFDVTAPATDEAREWDGWGTALKPAWEPIVVARKPLVGRVAANVLTYGTGALNIDATRPGGEPGWRTVERAKAPTGGSTAFLPMPTKTEEVPGGRWPANVVLTHHPDCRGFGTRRTELCEPDCPARMLNEQSGAVGGGDPMPRPIRERTEDWRFQGGGVMPSYGDSGGAARFFYCGKARRRERINGVERSLHPTVKPVGLMRWLVRLVARPDALILDPFTGSGTTGCAVMAEGADFLGFEQDETYARQATERIADYAHAFGRLTSAATLATTSPTAIAIPATVEPEEVDDDDHDADRAGGAAQGPARPRRRPDAGQGADGGRGEADGDEGQDAAGDARGEGLHGGEEGRDVRDRRAGGRAAPRRRDAAAGRGAAERRRADGGAGRGAGGEAGPEADAEDAGAEARREGAAGARAARGEEGRRGGVTDNGTGERAAVESPAPVGEETQDG